MKIKKKNPPKSGRRGIYSLTAKDKVLCFVKAFVYMSVAIYVFYKSIFGLIPVTLLGFYVFRINSREKLRKKKSLVLDQFKNMLTSMQGAIESGNSMERAILLSRRDLVELYGNDIELVKELDVLEKKLKVNKSLPEGLREMADNLELSEIQDFIQVISITLRTGGNTVQIVKDTVKRIVENIELDAELEVMVAGKRLEQQIMTYMPAGIILFLQVTSGDFLDPLYGNLTGRILMTLILFGNIFADYLGKRIVDVR
ncbi:MAG: hypothetical protein K6E10_03520 [Eubacterium sp.]|nr:hypothetical protein [Eubacterium sp.]